MNSKTVLNKILAALSLVNEPVEFTDAKDAEGNIFQSPNFDLGDDIVEVSADGTTTPVADGTYTISFTSPEGDDITADIEVVGGKVHEISAQGEATAEGETEAEPTEMAEADTDMVPVDEIPQQTQEDEVNVPQTVNGDIKSGTIKAASQKSLFVPGAKEGSPADAETTKDPSEGEVPEEIADKSQSLEELQARIDEMEKRFAKYEAMNPPVDSEVTDEEAGVKMSAEPDEEEELPKLDGAPIDEKPAQQFSDNRKNYGKTNKDSQSSFLSKLYK